MNVLRSCNTRVLAMTMNRFGIGPLKTPQNVLSSLSTDAAAVPQAVRAHFRNMPEAVAYANEAFAGTCLLEMGLHRLGEYPSLHDALNHVQAGSFAEADVTQTLRPLAELVKADIQQLTSQFYLCSYSNESGSRVGTLDPIVLADDHAMSSLCGMRKWLSVVVGDEFRTAFSVKGSPSHTDILVAMLLAEDVVNTPLAFHVVGAGWSKWEHSGKLAIDGASFGFPTRADAVGISQASRFQFESEASWMDHPTILGVADTAGLNEVQRRIEFALPHWHVEQTDEI